VIDELESATSTTSCRSPINDHAHLRQHVLNSWSRSAAWNCRCRRRCANRPILVNVWCAIWVAHGH